MESNEIILEKKVTKIHKKRVKSYYYFRYDKIPKCIILPRLGNRTEAFRLAHDWYKELEEEDDIF